MLLKCLSMLTRLGLMLEISREDMATVSVGKPAKNQTLLVRGERVSAIACMSSSGLLDVQTFQGTATGEVFYNFVQTHLLPHLMPYNGINPHSVVILDNWSSSEHKCLDAFSFG